MSHGWSVVQWNGKKRVYDLVVLAGILGFLGAFLGVGAALHGGDAGGGGISPEILAIRALGSCAFLLLTLTLCIGPLARLSDRFKPLLYNRRHLGVATFLIGFAHAAISTVWYHGFGVDDPLTSILRSNPRYDSFVGFPFEILGLGALAILFAMATTSHDYWLAVLGAPLWKALHMAVYAAYGLLVLHVALGVLQTETSPVYPVLLGASLACVGGLHVAAGLRERRRDRALPKTWALIVVEHPWAIPDKGARGVPLERGDTVAVFRDGDTVYAVANACAHQNGPLCEGKIVDGAITCPWHGFQYLPESGRSPPPFEEMIPTFRMVLSDGHLLLDPRPNPPGTPVTPVRLPPPV